MTKYLVLATLSVSALWGAGCDSLKSNFKGGEVTMAQSVDSGELAIAGRPVRGLPRFCRVAGSLRPTPGSDIRFEVWLPSTGWNGKFHGVGNGGFAGTINYAGLVDAVKNGYATASTDTGHQEPVNTSASWAFGHAERVVDFGWRGIHETAIAAKSLIHAFYGEDPKHSYFSSCSNGGRQALMEAQRFPADYDGIIAGAPAYDWTHLLSSGGEALRVTLGDPDAYFGQDKLPALQAAALSQCDLFDGVKDGVIENPAACHFDPSVLLCKGEETAQCLTAKQLRAVATNYAPIRDASGRALFPGMSPGGEADQGGWSAWITGTGPEKGSRFQFVTNFFKYIVYGDPAWDYKTFELAAATKAAEKVARDLNATDTNLSAFQQRGGKLLLYHGWSDAAIPPLATVKYYEDVVAKMKSADAFVKLYMVPGMGHCAGGSGPSNFGQLGTPSGDRFHSIDTALEAWVEQNQTPEYIVAAKPGRTRPLCAWPQVAKYKGEGSTDDAASFACAKP